MRVLVTGGAGFVGANIAVAFAQRHPDWQIVAFDNLKRRGSELNLSRLRGAGATFTHGDVRELHDLLAVGAIDVLIECSAEPSVLAGIDGDPDYLVKTNLLGAYNCLEIARREQAFLVFLSTSRVYPVAALRSVALEDHPTRYELGALQALPGVSADGFSEDFPLGGARTPYGATKLAAELLITEYAESFGLRAVVDRCGVIAGPWQMGKVDQGVFTYWVLAHYFGQPLAYIGYGGTGKQVRDILHVDDLVDLLEEQVVQPDRWQGQTVNVGGGRAFSLSLQEATRLCHELTGNKVEISAVDATRPGDVPIYVSDCSRLFTFTEWRPQRNARAILLDILDWARDNEEPVRAALGFA